MTRTKESATNKKRINFELATDIGADVFIVGTFSEWAPEKQLIDKDGNGVYSCTIMLPPGTYEYKFKINDSWVIDHDNPLFAQNNFGSLNSILVVQ